MSEESVQRTNDDATQCKMSAVAHGYWEDSYLSAFHKIRSGPDSRKAPEIHRGYYTRVKAIWNLLVKSIDYFCSKDQKFQVVNLGAGFDTLFWRISDHLEKCSLLHKLNSFVDIDLSEVTAKKCMAVRKSKVLLEKISQYNNEDECNDEVKFSRTDLHGATYHIVAANFTDLKTLESKLEECGVNYALPTIFIAECVFVYVDPNKTSAFLQWISTRFRSAPIALINHEQLNIFDRFGQVMLENLAQRGCALPGIEACRNKTSHLNRMLENGWQNGYCWTMNEIYNYLPKDEVERIEKLEFLDERELMCQLFEHYCVSFAWKSCDGYKLEEIDFW